MAFIRECSWEKVIFRFFIIDNLCKMINIKELRNLIKWVIYFIHFLSGIGTIILYIFFNSEEYFVEVGEKLVSIFLGSALLSAIFYKTQKPIVKIYFKSLAVLTLAYLGLWLILGLLIMR